MDVHREPSALEIKVICMLLDAQVQWGYQIHEKDFWIPSLCCMTTLNNTVDPVECIMMFFIIIICSQTLNNVMVSVFCVSAIVQNIWNQLHYIYFYVYVYKSQRRKQRYKQTVATKLHVSKHNIIYMANRVSVLKTKLCPKQSKLKTGLNANMHKNQR